MENTASLPIQSRNIRKTAHGLLLAAVALTLLTGLVISFVIFPSVTNLVGLENYGDGWAQIGENIVQGNGFVFNPDSPSTFMTGHLKREPGYSLFLAFILATFGKLDPYMMFFQSIINALTCFVLYFVVAKIFGGRVGLLSCFLYALYPFASWYVPRIAYESLLGLMITLLALSLVRLFERLSLNRDLLVGVVLGGTVLCRGIFLLFPVALLVGLIIRFGIKKARVVGHWSLINLIMLVILSPWVIRNYIISREFVPTTTQGGVSYFIGNKIAEYYTLRANTAGLRPEQEGARMYNQIRDAIHSENPSLSHAEVEAQTDKRLLQMAGADIVEHPLKFIQKILKGMVLVWFVSDTGLKSGALLALQAPLLIVSVFGIWWGLQERKPVLSVLTLLSYFVFIQTAFSCYGRYSYPMVPILIGFAAYALEMLRCKYLNMLVDERRKVGLPT